MSVLSWNCCSLGPNATVLEFKQLVARVRPYLIFLSEVRCSRQWVEGIRSQIGYDSSFVVRGEGTGGGLALIWDTNVVVNLKSYNLSHIDVDLAVGGNICRFTGFYGNPVRHLRFQSWNILRQLARGNSKPWIVMGDFNEILSSNEQFGGQPHPLNLIENFQQALLDCGLSDLGYTGYPFTWERKRFGEVVLRERLDRGLATAEWIRLHPHYLVRHELMSQSDHDAVILYLGKPQPQIRRFRYSNEWSLSRECREVVRNSWAGNLGGMKEKLEVLSSNLRAWSVENRDRYHR